MHDFKINLQLFAGEKTEKATPRRREEARKKGQVVKSTELITVLVLTLSLFALKYWLPRMALEFQNFYVYLMEFSTTEVSERSAMLLLEETILVTLKMAGPVILAALAAGYIANVMQVGFLYTTESLKLDFNRINPLSGFKRIFSKRAIAELLKTIFKTCLVGYVAFSYLIGQFPRLALLIDSTIATSLYTIGDITFKTLWRILGVLFVIAVADYAFQVYEYEESLKMSKQEIKEEYKNIEGDPQLKAKIKEKQRMLAMRRMMQDVPQATVVITNPTHLAIAIKYNDNMAAPIVVAKGQDYVAQKIKEIAKENNVIIMENKKLARVLYEKVDIGMTIPMDLYKAIEEVLAYVYKLKGHL
jgi:flagellar biosynthetic protein FlhB